MPASTPRAAGACYAGKTPIVRADQVVKWDRWGGGKNRLSQCFEPALEGLRSHPQIIETQVQQKGQPHEIELTHVFVFVQIQRFEPTRVTAAEVGIVPGNQRLKGFAPLLS